MRQYPTSPWGALLFPSPVGAHHALRDSDPNLPDYHDLAVNHGGGKDGLTALIVVVGRAAAAGVLNRVVVQYNDLGDAAWPGTREADEELAADGVEPWLVERFGERPGSRDLAEAHARHFGLRFEVRSRQRPATGDGAQEPNRVELLDEVLRRGKFPDAARRWCTSDFKRGPGHRLLTDLTRERGLDGPARILYVFGYRAQESRSRARKLPCVVNQRASNLTRRHVTDWYPVHHWTEEQVWAEIRASGLPWAWPYDAGMSRLSCSLCVLASKKDLLTAIRLRPRVARRYAAVEAFTGHSFQQARTIKALMAEAGIPARPLTDRNGWKISAGDVVREFTNGRIGPEPAGQLVGTFTVVRVDKAAGVLFTDRYAERGQPESVAFPADVQTIPASVIHRDGITAPLLSITRAEARRRWDADEHVAVGNENVGFAMRPSRFRDRFATFDEMLSSCTDRRAPSAVHFSKPDPLFELLIRANVVRQRRYDDIWMRTAADTWLTIVADRDGHPERHTVSTAELFRLGDIEVPRTPATADSCERFATPLVGATAQFHNPRLGTVRMRVLDHAAGFLTGIVAQTGPVTIHLLDTTAVQLAEPDGTSAPPECNRPPTRGLTGGGLPPHAAKAEAIAGTSR